ncbi:hypothetical protein F5883DRAFT_707030 [Diaporthe sp. PMI_573]|nr:hypothetical protein F5883DRAFT_707030 [Diaporthaceae sp. PMI_573]
MADATQSLVNSSWDEDAFADATIIMGQKKWRVHRVIICKQSQYFKKALEGHFMEAKTKTINLTGSSFLEEEVDGLLKYLYTRQLSPRQSVNPIRTYVVADYFQVWELRAKATKQASNELQKLLKWEYFVNFRERCHTVLGEYPDTHLEATVLKVIADNILVVMYESKAWDELTAAYPRLPKKVLDVLYPKPEPNTGVKRAASVAFDDARQAARTGTMPPPAYASVRQRMGLSSR